MRRTVVCLLSLLVLGAAATAAAHDCSDRSDCEKVPSNVDVAVGVAAGAAGVAIGAAVFGMRRRSREGGLGLGTPREPLGIARDVPPLADTRPGGLTGGLGKGDAPAPPTSGSTTTKPGGASTDTGSTGGKPSEPKPADAKPTDAKPTDPKSTEAKPADPKTSESPTGAKATQSDLWKKYPILNEPLGEDKPRPGDRIRNEPLGEDPPSPPPRRPPPDPR